MRKALVFVCALSAVAAVAAQTKSPQKPGKWQIKMEMEMPGMPVKMPPITMEHCVTEADLADPQKSVPSNDPKSECKVSNYTVKGNTVTWSMDCPKQQMKGSGEITYTNETFDGTMKMSMSGKEMSTKYSGKWLGTCTK